MGGFVSTVCSFVRWIGQTICRVVDWFADFVENVSQVVKSFIFGIEQTIRSADNPKLFGEAAAIRKERGELDKKANDLFRQLSRRDQNNLDDLFRDHMY